MSNRSLDDMMRKIQAMLDRADHPNTPGPEADACRAKAEKWMNEYRIEEEELRARGDLHIETITPGSKMVILCPADSPYYNAYWSMACYIGIHTGVRIKSKWVFDGNAYSLAAIMVGFEADIRYAESIYTNARLVFGDRMEPKVDRSLSDQENVYRLRSAGIERIKIAKMMGYGETNSATAKVTALYKRACKVRGEDPALTGRGTSVKVFKDTYVSGFLSQFNLNLYNARNAAGTGGTALVLHDRKSAVDEAYYELFPAERPSDLPAVANRKARTRRWTAADERRLMQQNSAAGLAGRLAGKRAASEVNINATKAPGRLES